MSFFSISLPNLSFISPTVSKKIDAKVTNTAFSMGAFHYAKLTGRRSVGIPEENGTRFSDKTGPTSRNGSCHFKFFFRIPQLGQRTALQKMERQISVGIFRPKYVDHLQRRSRIFRSEETETDLSI